VVVLVLVRSRAVALEGRSHAVCLSRQPLSSIVSPGERPKGKDTYLVRIHLELHRQHRRRDVVHQIRCAHRTSCAESKPPSAIWVVRVPDYVCGRIDDGSEVGEVLDGGGGDGNGCQNDAREEHGEVSGVGREHARLINSASE
jgi:hypothetical protein